MAFTAVRMMSDTHKCSEQRESYNVDFGRRIQSRGTAIAQSRDKGESAKKRLAQAGRTEKVQFYIVYKLFALHGRENNFSLENQTI